MSYIGKNPKVDSVKLDGSATVPSGATVEGQVYFNTGTGAISEGLKVYKNGQYVSIDKQLGDADTIDLLKASDIGGLQWGVAINSTSTTVGMNSPVPQYNATATGFASTSAFANSSTGNALLTNESADIVFAYESGAANCKNDYFGIQVDIPKAFRGQNLVLQFEYRTEEASGASSNNDFLVSIQDDTNKAQTTNSTTTGSQAAGTSVAVASSTGFAVGDFVRVESGTAASGNQANSFTEAYVTAIADSTHLTFSETIVFPASGTSGIIAANWLIDQNAGQLVEADSDSNKVGKVYKVQFKTEETTAKINISIMNQSTTAAGIDIFIDNILISANKFLQASSQTKSEAYYVYSQSNVWDATGTGPFYEWDVSLIDPGPDTPPLADSKLLSMGDITGPGTIGTVTAITAKQNITIYVTFTAYCSNSGELFLENSSAQHLAASYAPNSAAAGYENLGATINLAKDDYIYFKTYKTGARDGMISVTATPQTSDVILLESQDEIFTDWTEFTMTPTNGGTVTKGTIVVDKALWRRVAGNMEIMWDYKQSTTGASGTGNTVYPIPSGYEIDTSKLYVSSTTAYASVGTFKASFSASNGLSTYAANGMVTAENSTQLALFGASAYNAFSRISATNFGFGAEAQLGLTMRVSIPIQGWNSNFNPLLSMPLVDIGADTEYYLINYFDNACEYSLESTKTPINNTIDKLGTVVNSTTADEGFHFEASQRVKVTFNWWGRLASGNGYNGLVKCAKSYWNTGYSINNAYWDNLRIANVEEETGYVRGVCASAVLEPGEVIGILRDDTTAPLTSGTPLWASGASITVERDYSHTNMAHIIKPAVATIKNYVDSSASATGGQISTANTWVQTPLNVIEGESWFVTLSGTGTTGIAGTNINFTLDPGTYKITGSMPFNGYPLLYVYSRLYDVTNSTAVAAPTSSLMNDYATWEGIYLPLSVVITITQATKYQYEGATSSTSISGLHMGYAGNSDTLSPNPSLSVLTIEKLK